MTRRVTTPGSDLTAEIFLALRRAFFDRQAKAKVFDLRPKLNTQDDPFDEYVHDVLTRELAGVMCVKAPGPLVTPDEVVFRPSLCDGVPREQLRNDLERVVGVEVKKLLRAGRGSVARASGMDYNTTPPCGTIRVYDATSRPLEIRGFYLFVCLQPVEGQPLKFTLTALALCDGNVLNEDFELYLAIVGAREKKIGLGTYADGVNRERPMLIFSNPLGAPALDRHATLVHPSDTLARSYPSLRLACILTRTGKDGQHRFFGYRAAHDVPADWSVEDLVDPFPTPAERKKETQGRGRFRLPVRPA